jgi:hypothetical protein
MIECGGNHRDLSADPANVRGQRTSRTADRGLRSERPMLSHRGLTGSAVKPRPMVRA